jgi:V8-like Glu-specific endopeptidase
MKISYLSFLIILGFSFQSSPSKAIIFDNQSIFYGMNDFMDQYPNENNSILDSKWQVISNSTKPSYFNSVGRIYPTGCTAFLIKSNKSKNSQNIYGVTNGHCFGLPYKSNNIKINFKPEQRFYMAFPNTSSTLTIDTVVYQTLYNTDVAIFTFKESVNLKNKKPYNLVNEEQLLNLKNIKLNMISIPIIFDFRNMRAGNILRYSQCIYENPASLIEGDYSFPYSFQHKCNALNGSSGSPISTTHQGNEVLIGIHNTSPSDDLEDEKCLPNHPCEVNGNIKKMENYNYGQDLTKLESCFDKDGKFNLQLPKCFLRWKNGTYDSITGSKLVFKKHSSQDLMVLLKNYKSKNKNFPVAGDIQPFDKDKQIIPWSPENNWIKKWNNDVQLKIFGKILFPIFMTELENEFSITLNSSTEKEKASHGYILLSKNIYDHMKLKYSNSEQFKLIIKFFIAHEISHYIYEWYLMTQTSDFRSIHGGISMDMNQKIQDEYNNSVFKNISLKDFGLLSTESHVEVDWIALAVMKELGLKLSWNQYKEGTSIMYISLSEQDHFIDIESVNSNYIRIDTMKASWNNF